MKNLLYISGTALIAFLFSSCEGMWPNCVDGNGLITSEQRVVGTFNRVESEGDFHVYIYPGEESNVEVEADENLMGLIVTRVYHGELILETRHNDCLRSSGPVRITVTTPDLNSIELDGSGKIWCDSMVADHFKVDLDGSGGIECVYLEASAMDLEISGSGILEVNGFFDETSATIEGSGDLILSGESVNAGMNVTGSGNIAAGNLLTTSCNADISGSGSITTWVTDVLDVDISGSGTVYYYGEPAVVNTHVSGSGKVIKKH